MKAEELSVGLWVNVGHCHSNIDGDYDVKFVPERLTLQHFKFWADNDWNKNDFDEFLEPIPITKEILIKNGFSETGIIDDSYIHYIVADSFYYEIEINLQDNILRITNTWFKADDIRYVHELQLALRLYHIDKEIEL